ncbi:hypothetical protein TWF102_012008 [Orbilia oligospora]|uniref:Secreted protein n=1 Tax=Orbilia oligospora TaxID=2813651 RepID=A0A7C8N626_ORBOL|nr:hypothetical protein TWF102_012008 [Orbilia oligospora]KAF3108235.1 hypothetical protein TWF706_011990 [Orbilia oligospora]
MAFLFTFRLALHGFFISRRLFQCHPCGAAVDRTRQYPKDTLQLRSLPQNNLKDDYLSRRLIVSSFYTGSTTLGNILKRITLNL